MSFDAAVGSIFVAVGRRGRGARAGVDFSAISAKSWVRMGLVHIVHKNLDSRFFTRILLKFYFSRNGVGIGEKVDHVDQKGSKIVNFGFWSTRNEKATWSGWLVFHNSSSRVFSRCRRCCLILAESVKISPFASKLRKSSGVRDQKYGRAPPSIRILPKSSYPAR